MTTAMSNWPASSTLSGRPVLSRTAQYYIARKEVRDYIVRGIGERPLYLKPGNMSAPGFYAGAHAAARGVGAVTSSYFFSTSFSAPF